jgi:photosystem II stability/assembly factor-like uncharacterized protein
MHPVKKIRLFILLLLLVITAVSTRRTKQPLSGKMQSPIDYFWAQRAFPAGKVPSDAYYAAQRWADSRAGMRDNSLNWEFAGPTHVSGRITDVAMHPGDTLTIYAASASGGVWKSDDEGESWIPISDQLPTLSIGDIALDPSDKNTLYVGTGEPNAGGGSVAYDGQGLFKTTDGGATWTSLGLLETGSIGRVVVDPTNPQRLFVAAMGTLFANNPERGIYRSDDGGATWNKSLFVNDSTGGVDLAIHPFNPDTVYAVTWQRVRRPEKRVYGGPGSAIWRSTDGGDSWTKLQNGLPAAGNGRIGIDISASNPNVLYAIYADITGFYKGVYKSMDSGNSWEQLPSESNPVYYSFGWWFGQIRIHPHHPDEVFTLGVDWVKTTDGGDFWQEVSPVYLHADYHALYIHPEKPSFQVAGNDGGIYISRDAGASWVHKPFPITQFYTTEINNRYPALLSGGAQDNGTWRSKQGGIDDWEFFSGGDGFVTLVHPTDTSIYYASSQYGGMSGSNGATAPLSDRYNWNSPYILAPQNPNILYFGAERLFKSTNGGLDWTAISDDLSNGDQGQNGVVYGTITTIAASPQTAGVIWAGTDDGNVWFSANDGASWEKVSDTLPKRWITRVVADPFDKNAALVCLSGFRKFDNKAHVYRTVDQGQTWQNVSGDLPDVPVNDLVIDPQSPENVWYIATDAGVFETRDGGMHWLPCNANLPKVPVVDLVFHAPTRSIAAATYGRAMYRATLPDITGVLTPSNREPVQIFPNPVAETATVVFQNTVAGRITMQLYNGAGQFLRTAFQGEMMAGENRQTFSAEGLAPGVYLLAIRSSSGALKWCKWVKQ